MHRYRGQGDVQCPACNREYNAFGQLLRPAWRDNESCWNDDVSDVDGYEASQLRAENARGY